MLYTEKNRLHKNNDSEQTPRAERHTVRTYVCEFSANQIKEALIPDLELSSPSKN